eukprot:TRINITY_DN5260_c0_g1_i1.p1 TRINITY_DN5260_c0_g1~~TRINITY_DN5260_c0_g1_i1.p1  ORF type:complete len:114 (+),score=15.37 TRINITY_DN5260_c0_g1_i1:89-430(+)
MAIAKKTMDDDSEGKLYCVENIQHNQRIVYYSRMFLSIVGGCVTGILGLTGIGGILCYFITMAIATLALFMKTGFSADKYFVSWYALGVDGIFSGLMSFFLFWTLVYDIVHIF